MLNVVYSNRVERLAERLAERLRQPPADPLASDTVVVQNGGMGRWLALYIASRLGVCTNVLFPFTGTYLWQLSRALLPDLSDLNGYDRSILVWRLRALLAQLDDDDGDFAPLLAYRRAAAAERDPLRLFELAARLADVFDQYQIYRPDWLYAWQRGEQPPLPAGRAHRDAAVWQAGLWRRLLDDGATGAADHRGAVTRRLLAALASGRSADGAAVDQRLPQRFSLFGISSLAPLQIDTVAALAERVDITLYVANPCRHYWGGIVADRDLARRDAATDPAEQYLEVGNPLLASFGKQGRDFIDRLQELPTREFDDYEEPAPELERGALLTLLQSDILELYERGADGVKTALDDGDDSLQLHACHGPRREVEVLHDRLLRLFEDLPGLRPADVIVMTPDVELYAPLIEAVFAPRGAGADIPYSVADRDARGDGGIVDRFLQLLEIAGGRFEAARLLELLDCAPLRRRFGIDADQLRQARHWVHEVGIRWGVDRDSRSALDLPAESAHTWRVGLERLLLGHALPGGGARLRRGVLPYDDLEGSDAQLLGRLHSFLDGAFALRELAAQRLPLTRWCERLTALLDQFFDAADAAEQDQLTRLGAALIALRQHGEHAGFREPLALAEMRAALAERLSRDAESGLSGFFAGKLTFCTLVPMRSVPFRVVCLIGMNSDAYPRAATASDFDLLGSHFRHGDRSRRQDDRYLFLEALLAARDTFYLSYVGSSIHDNSERPPSVLISELCEIIDRGFCAADGAPASGRLRVRHPLSGFSPRYFGAGDDARLFSYAPEMAEVARLLSRPRRPRRFFAEPLPPPDDGLRHIDAAALTQFFRHPTKFLLQRRLQLRLDDAEPPSPLSEPFVLDGLDRYRLRQWLLTLFLRGTPRPQAAELAAAAAVLPHGQIGAASFDEQWQTIERFGGRLRRRFADHALALEPAALPLALEVDGFSVGGVIDDVGAGGSIGYRPAQINAADRMTLWVRHVLLCCAVAQDKKHLGGVAPYSRWLGLDDELALQPLQRPRAELTRLLSHYWRGLTRPLRFFPGSGFAYMNQRATAGRGRVTPLQKARERWRGSEQLRGEGDDPYYRLAFDDEEPLDDEFETLTRALLEPFYYHLDAPDRDQ